MTKQFVNLIPQGGDTYLLFPVSGELLADALTDGSAFVNLAPTSGTQNRIQPTGNFLALTLRAAALQTQPLLKWEDSAGNPVGYLYPGVSGVPSLYALGPDFGIQGDTSAGSGVLATTITGIGLDARAVGAGIAVTAESAGGISGLFRSSAAANATATLVTRQRGASTANLFEVQSDAGSSLVSISSAGEGFFTRLNTLSLKVRRTAIAATPTSVDPSARIILGVDTSALAITLNISNVSGSLTSPYVLIVKDEANNAAANNITINPPGGGTIDGVAGAVVIAANGGSVRLYGATTTWFTW